MYCPACSRPTQPDWKFCQACGGSLPPEEALWERDTSVPAAASSSVALAVATAPNGTVGVATEQEDDVDAPTSDAKANEHLLDAAVLDREPPTPYRRRWPVVVGGLLVLLAFGALGAFAFATHTDLEETSSELRLANATLEDTRETLSATQQDLEQRSSELDSTRAQLDETRSTLEARTAERDGLRDDLAAAETEIAGLEGSLEETQGSLAAQQRQTTLQAGQIAVLKECLGGVSLSLQYGAYGYWEDALAALQAVEYSCDQAAALF